MAVLTARRAALATAAALACAACFELELDGVVRSGGTFSGKARIVVPRAVRTDRRMAQAVMGNARSIEEVWRAQGATVVPLPGQRYMFAVTAPSLGALSLPWMRLDWTEADGRWHFGAQLRFPADLLPDLEAQLERRLGTVARSRPAGNDQVERLAESLADQAHVSLALEFPESPTAANGVVDGRRVVWRWSAADLRTGTELQAAAAGAVGWWAILRDAVMRWWD